MRVVVLLSLLATLVLPSSIVAAQTPPIVVVGPPPASAGPPPEASPTVPRGYEIEGDLGGMHFRARVTTPGQPAPIAPPVVAPPVVAPPPQTIIIQQATQPTSPVMVVQPQTAPQQSYAPPMYPQMYPQYAQPMQPADRRPQPRLDEGMDFPARLALDVLGAGAGFGLATGLAYLVNDRPHDSGFAPTLIGAMSGLAPMGISLFGGAMAGGRGTYGGALLGELIGGGLSATILAAGDVHFHEPWELIAAIAGPAILGAIIGFEAQHGLRTARLEQRMEQQQGPQLSGISVAPTAQGNGALVGLTGTF